MITNEGISLALLIILVLIGAVICALISIGLAKLLFKWMRADVEKLDAGREHLRDSMANDLKELSRSFGEYKDDWPNKQNAITTAIMDAVGIKINACHQVMDMRIRGVEASSQGMIEALRENQNKLCGQIEKINAGIEKDWSKHDKQAEAKWGEIRREINMLKDKINALVSRPDVTAKNGS